MGPRERQILSACHLDADPVLDDEQARISVNGGELEAACEACRGSVSRPLTVPEVIDKFRLVAGLDDPEAIARPVMIGDGDLGELLHVR
jgi:hypothetical protein